MNMNMNKKVKYTIEENIDFKKELENDIEIDNDILDETCMISQQPLTKTHISLPCNHKFNYKTIFDELCIQKDKKNVYDTDHLKVNQLKCPYCRTVYDILLPYIPSECDEKLTGINYPFKYSMYKDLKCNFKSKNNTCIKETFYVHEDNIGYCKLHYNKVCHQSKDIPKQVWTEEMTLFLKNKTIIDLKKILRLHKLRVGGKKRDLVERIFLNNVNQ